MKDMMELYRVMFNDYKRETAAASAAAAAPAHDINMDLDLDLDDDDDDDEECLHVRVTEDPIGCIACNDCGEIVRERKLAFPPNKYGHRKKKPYTDIFNLIPFFVKDETKDVAIDIYQTVIANQRFSPADKKSILLASIYRAATVCDDVISCKELTVAMDVKQRQITNGLNILVTLLPKQSKYSIPIFYDMMLVDSNLMALGMTEHSAAVKRIIELLQRHSEMLNLSHYQTIVYVAIYTWIQLTGADERLFKKTIAISSHTLSVKYTEARAVLMKLAMKRIFSGYLSSLTSRTSRGKAQPPKHDHFLVNRRSGIEVHNYWDADEIRMRGRNGVWLPIDDVTDIFEWNAILVMKFHFSTRGGGVAAAADAIIVHDRHRRLSLTFNNLSPTESEVLVRDAFGALFSAPPAAEALESSESIATQ